MSDLSDESVAVQWLERSSEVFHALKREFSLGDSWSFSIADPDGVPSDIDPQDLRDMDGAVAFMLRRIQAIRHLLLTEGGGEWQAHLLTGYASDLYVFLHALGSSRRIANPLEEGIIAAGAIATKNLLGLVVNSNN